MIPFILWIRYIFAMPIVAVLYITIWALSCVSAIGCVLFAIFSFLVPNLSKQAEAVMSTTRWNGDRLGDDWLVGYAVTFQYLEFWTGALRLARFVESANDTMAGKV